MAAQWFCGQERILGLGSRNGARLFQVTLAEEAAAVPAPCHPSSGSVEHSTQVPASGEDASAFTWSYTNQAGGRSPRPQAIPWDEPSLGT